ncbi:hypothetical protein EYZ11_002651 [Aspergillus tanneri]|uniref:Uncharacterized protein n=1 Tax=Aspergillus tanneri TaxID=1220188 RepID=A0A4S3JU07_9EURO|nr:hypothetical protein EYZ11_002651 [Aspergillus tanneri]
MDSALFNEPSYFYIDIPALDDGCITHSVLSMETAMIH